MEGPQSKHSEEPTKHIQRVGDSPLEAPFGTAQLLYLFDRPNPTHAQKLHLDEPISCTLLHINV